METNAILTFILGIVIIGIFGKILLFPLKKILKLILNSCLGGLLIFIINVIGNLFNFHIGLNIITSIFVRYIRNTRCYIFNNTKNNIKLKQYEIIYGSYP